MRIGLFVANVVGRDVAACFGERGERPACLVLDRAGDATLNDEIVRRSGIDVRSDVVLSDALYEPSVLARLAALKLDLIVLAWWPYIVKAPVLGMPRLGCLNLHPSLLPWNRGKHYNFWNLVEEAPFGVSIHWADAGVDSGDVAFQADIPKAWEDTGETLYRKAQAGVVTLFRECFDEIRAGRIPRQPQDRSRGSFHRASELEPASRIELDHGYTARALLNLLRARTFPPHPAAWFTDGGQTFEVRVQIRRAEGPRT
jgi:methionyl-tRNA formyltransferase